MEFVYLLIGGFIFYAVIHFYISLVKKWNKLDGYFKFLVITNAVIIAIALFALSSY